MWSKFKKNEDFISIMNLASLALIWMLKVYHNFFNTSYHDEMKPRNKSLLYVPLIVLIFS